METISIIILPLIVLTIIISGLVKKINIYDEFLEGAKEGLLTSIKIIPNIIAMILAINILIKSNIITDMFSFSSNILNKINLTSDIIPMCILRSISGTSTLALLANILTTYGPDSTMGLLASTIQGSSDTTFYVIALYFGSIGIIKNRYAITVGLFADLCGIIASFLIVYLFFGM